MKIPKVDKGSVIVVRAESATGKILNNDNSFYNSIGDDYYLIMESLDEARSYANKEIEKGLVEVLIYDDKSEFIEIHRR